MTTTTKIPFTTNIIIPSPEPQPAEVRFQLVIERARDLVDSKGFYSTKDRYHTHVEVDVTWWQEDHKSTVLSDALSAIVKAAPNLEFVKSHSTMVRFTVGISYEATKLEIESNAAEFVGLPLMAGQLHIGKVEFKTSDYDGIIGHIHVGASEGDIAVELGKALEEIAKARSA